MDCLVIGNNCNFQNVPLIGMQTQNPTVEDIMRHVIVSHDWMGTRFREILERMPPEVLLLMRGITGVVISYDIRPSFYTVQTGAMYLDPDRMWLTEAERSVIDDDPDPRGAFGQQLQFIILWRYVEGNTDIRNFPRSIESISRNTAALLFHELAHANDYFPPSTSANITSSASIQSLASPALSNQLSATFPLSAQLMFDVAEVSFFGATPTPAEAALTSTDIAGVFPNDTANDYYNYSTQREDLAMAFEEAMMYYSYGLSRDVAVTNYPDSNSCADYLVAWGQRNRIADAAIQARSVQAVSTILPELAAQVEDAIGNMPGPTQMAVNVNWCENINLSPAQTALRSLSTADIYEGAHPEVEITRPYE